MDKITYRCIYITYNMQNNFILNFISYLGKVSDLLHIVHYCAGKLGIMIISVCLNYTITIILNGLNQVKEFEGTLKAHYAIGLQRIRIVSESVRFV